MPTQTSQATGVVQLMLISMTISQNLFFTQRLDGVIETALFFPSNLLRRGMGQAAARKLQEFCKIIPRLSG
jgi:hypothetical protein